MEILRVYGTARMGEGGQCVEHGTHWQMARFELPIKEVERKQGQRTVIDIVVSDHEDLAYVHKYTGKRVEFARPRLDNMGPALDEAEAKWHCELELAAYDTAERKRQKADNIVGFIDLATVRTTAKIVNEWHALAKSPDYVKWPTKLAGVAGAFGVR